MNRHVPLSRTTIVAAAVAVADRDGLEKVSMRRLGDQLGVEAMSLYNHVPSKAALLDAMVDTVLGEITVPTDGDWRTGLHGRCVGQRRVFHAHRWALGVVESRRNPGLPNLRHHDAVLGYLRGTGFSTRAAGHVYSMLDAYVMGFVLQEQQLPFDSASAPEVAESMLAAHPPAELPHLEAYYREVVSAGDYDYADEFDVGLDLVLDAVATLRG
jgi:AcrR family transcriptional regulator